MIYSTVVLKLSFLFSYFWSQVLLLLCLISYFWDAYPTVSFEKEFTVNKFFETLLVLKYSLIQLLPCFASLTGYRIQLPCYIQRNKSNYFFKIVNVFLLSFFLPICIVKKINTILILLAMIWFSSCKHFNFFSLFPFMDISWWSMSVWITFFSFIVLGSWCIPSIKKTQILLLWNVYLYYYCWYFDTILPALRFFFFFLISISGILFIY